MSGQGRLSQSGDRHKAQSTAYRLQTKDGLEISLSCRDNFIVVVTSWFLDRFRPTNSRRRTFTTKTVRGTHELKKAAKITHIGDLLPDLLTMTA